MTNDPDESICDAIKHFIRGVFATTFIVCRDWASVAEGKMITEYILHFFRQWLVGLIVDQVLAFVFNLLDKTNARFQ